MLEEDDQIEPIREMSTEDYRKNPQRRSREQFIIDYTKLVNLMSQSDFHEDTKREILYQAIRIYSGHNGYFDHREKTWISTEAESLCDANGKAKERRTIIKEHIVPISVSIEWFLSASAAGGTNEQRMRELFDAASDICIVSKNEDQRLSAAKLKKNMPQPWNAETDDRWARYDHEEVNIKRKRLRP